MIIPKPDRENVSGDKTYLHQVHCRVELEKTRSPCYMNSLMRRRDSEVFSIDIALKGGEGATATASSAG